MTVSRPVIHGRDHRPGGPDPIPGLGLPNAMVWKTVNFNIAATTQAQLDFDNSTFATTDAAVFTVGSDGILINETGLYLALLNVVNDNTEIVIDKTAVNIRWTAGAGSVDELIVPRTFTGHDSGGALTSPNGDSPVSTDAIQALSWAYVADVSGSGSLVTAHYFNHDTGTIHVNQRLLTVVQLQAIGASLLADFSAYPA